MLGIAYLALRVSVWMALAQPLVLQPLSYQKALLSALFPWG